MPRLNGASFYSVAFVDRLHGTRDGLLYSQYRRTVRIRADSKWVKSKGEQDRRPGRLETGLNTLSGRLLESGSAAKIVKNLHI